MTRDNCNGRYILNGHIPVPEPDLMKWVRWFETANRLVSRTTTGEVEVSTVFLGLDYGIFNEPPRLFETLVLGGPHDQEGERYETWEEAEIGHRKWAKTLDE